MAAGEPTITALTDRDCVLRAIAEFDELGRGAFLAKYGYQRARWLRLRYGGKDYDSKAIAGVAWGLQLFNDGRRRPHAYTGGTRTAGPVLRKLNFEIVRVEDPLPRIRPGKTYDWDELGEMFAFKPQYLGSVGGMVPRPKLECLLLITHSQGGRTFDYGDEWDTDDELIYAGRGLTGDQHLAGANLQVAENSQTLFLFEYAGKHKLLFHGEVHCADYWQSTGFDKREDERRVYRFRLRLLTGKGRRRARRGRPKQTESQERDLSSFRARPFDPDRKPSARRKGAPGDPESRRVLAEQADKDHQETLRMFGLWLKEEGWLELEEMDGGIDLMANQPGVRRAGRVLFEIKSIASSERERTRVRSGLAQLLEYRLFFGEEKDRLCLVSNRPIQERRLRLLDSLGIAHVFVEGDEVQVSGTKSSRAIFPLRETGAGATKP